MSNYSYFEKRIPLNPDEVPDYVWLSLGTNQGNPDSIIQGTHKALSTLTDDPIHLSALYKTLPWGYLNQPPFLNQVIGIRPKVQDPEFFLNALQQIELEFNRKREIRWGPRTLDLDLLAWPDLTYASSKLTLPHPRLHLRRFVLIPWADLVPWFYVEGYCSTVQELMLSCPDSSILCCLFKSSLP